MCRHYERANNVTKWIIIPLFFISALFSERSEGADTIKLLFYDDFNSKADWSPPQPSSNTLSCIKGQNCSTSLPDGYYDYRVAALEQCSNRDGKHNTLNISSNYPRGKFGKSFQYWSEPCFSSSGSWGSDGLLGVAFEPQSELYVRYWMRFQQNWIWLVGGESPMQKFLHISHYDPENGSELWNFHDGIQNKPRFTPQFAKWGGGTYRTQLDLPHSPLTANRDNSASFNVDVGLGPSPQDWSNEKAPGDGFWHCYEYYVKLNSTGGTADGISRAWYDGNLIAEKTDVVWIPAGDNPANWQWNHAWLGGNNSNPYSPKNEQWYAIDDFVVSTNYSGPPPPPVNVKVKSLNSTTARITWEAGSNKATYQVGGYKIYYGTSKDNLTNSVIIGNVTSGEVTGLQSGQKYYFAVSGFSKGTYEVNENESIKSVLVKP